MFIHKNYKKKTYEHDTTKLPNDDLYSKDIIEKVKYENGKKIISYEEKLTNITKKTNEMAKALKTQNADLISKMQKIIETENL